LEQDHSDQDNENDIDDEGVWNDEQEHRSQIGDDYLYGRWSEQ